MLSGDKPVDSADVSAGRVSEWERLDSDMPELSAWMSLTKSVSP